MQLLKPIQERYRELRESDQLMKILDEGAQRAREISNKKLKEVYDKVGFVEI